VLLYGTRNRKVTTNAAAAPRDQNDEDSDEDDSDFEGPTQGSTSHVLLPLEPPSVPQYNTVRECLDDPVMERVRDLQADYADDNPCSDNFGFQQHPLQTALLQASQMFRRAKCVKKKTASSTASTTNNDDVKELWIFTNQDNPTMSKEQVERLLLRTAKDVKENDIEIVLWPLPNPKKDHESFDRHIFFDKIAKGTKNHRSIVTTDNDTAKTVLSLDDLLEILDRERKKMRRISIAPLFLPTSNLESSPGIMLDLYRHVRLQKIPYAKHIHQQKKK
jgi:hypothetical protein